MNFVFSKINKKTTSLQYDFYTTTTLTLIRYIPHHFYLAVLDPYSQVGILKHSDFFFNIMTTFVPTKPTNMYIDVYIYFELFPC